MNFHSVKRMWLHRFVTFRIGECLGSLLKMFKVTFLPCFEELISYMTPKLVSALQGGLVWAKSSQVAHCTSELLFQL
ncbi:hypothetical protein CY35_06G076000 [Sphagnum magellanicum]|nr:hypothetical protein CY35_06G076000 [Sphagnum magellanicum]